MTVRLRSLLLGGAGAIGAALLCWQLTRLLSWIPAPADETARLRLATAMLLPSVAVLMAMLLVQMGARFIGGVFDPTAGQDFRLLVVNQRAITNTVEQLACFVPSLLALSLAPVTVPGRTALIAALGLTFALARVVFWIGYLTAPLNRAPGMAATIVVTLVALAAAARAWIG